MSSFRDPWVKRKKWVLDAIHSDPYIYSIFCISDSELDFFEKVAEFKTAQAKQFFDDLILKKFAEYNVIIATKETIDRVNNLGKDIKTVIKGGTK